MDRSKYIIKYGDIEKSFISEDIAYEHMIKILYPHVSAEIAFSFFLEGYNLRHSDISDTFKAWSTPWAHIEYYRQAASYQLEMIKDNQTIPIKIFHNLKDAEDGAYQLMGWWLHIPWYGYTRVKVDDDTVEWQSTNTIIRIKLLD